MRKKRQTSYRFSDNSTPTRQMDNGAMQRPGIEPGPEPWEGSIIPLDYRCLVVTLSPVGF